MLAIIFYHVFSAFLIIICLYFLMLAFINQVFIVIAKAAITTEIPTKEENSEMETRPVTVEAKISKWSV